MKQFCRAFLNPNSQKKSFEAALSGEVIFLSRTKISVKPAPQELLNDFCFSVAAAAKPNPCSQSPLSEKRSWPKSLGHQQLAQSNPTPEKNEAALSQSALHNNNLLKDEVNKEALLLPISKAQYSMIMRFYRHWDIELELSLGSSRTFFKKYRSREPLLWLEKFFNERGFVIEVSKWMKQRKMRTLPFRMELCLGEACGGLLENDQRTLAFPYLFEARIKVKGLYSGFVPAAVNVLIEGKIFKVQLKAVYTSNLPEQVICDGISRNGCMHGLCTGSKVEDD
ncbi:alpha-amylase [Sarracenia purpurea var. burkii]